jgi:hypothetical protein
MTAMPLHININLNIFQKFSMQYSMKNSNGILDGNLLNVGKDGEIIDQDSLATMTNFFHNFKGGIALRTLAISIKKECSMPKIILFFGSLNSIIGKTILYLSFEGSALGIDGITVFCDILKQNQLKQIKKLNINRCNSTELGIKKIRLTTVKHCPNLEEICISSNSAPSSVLEFFQSAYFLKAKPLVRIEARDNGLDLQSTLIAPIVTSGTLSVYHLRKLDLSANTLTDSGFLLLMKTIWPVIDSEGREVINETYLLEELILDYTEFGNQSLTYLGNILERFVSLKTLSLKGNEISFGSLKYFLDKLPLVPQLTSLCIASNPLGNEGIMVFVNTALCRNLIHLISLDIGDCGAGSESLNHLARAIGFSPDKHAIKFLRIYGNSPELQNCIINSQLTKEYLKIVKLM